MSTFTSSHALFQVFSDHGMDRVFLVPGESYLGLLDAVVDFKRGVYQMALTELSRYLPRQELRQRLYRATPRMMGQLDPHGHPPDGLELPPGGSFDPHPDGTNR